MATEYGVTVAGDYDVLVTAIFASNLQNPLSGSHATESKHSFAPWRKGPRRSVILK